MEDGRGWGIDMSDECQMKEMKRRRIGNWDMLEFSI